MPALRAHRQYVVDIYIYIKNEFSIVRRTARSLAALTCPEQFANVNKYARCATRSSAACASLEYFATIKLMRAARTRKKGIYENIGYDRCTAQHNLIAGREIMPEFIAKVNRIHTQLEVFVGCMFLPKMSH